MTLTTDQVASQYGVTPRAARKWCAAGLFPNARKVGANNRATWMIPVDDLDGFDRPKMGRPKIAS